jgi:hypothetical protein
MCSRHGASGRPRSPVGGVPSHRTKSAALRPERELAGQSRREPEAGDTADAAEGERGEAESAAAPCLRHEPTDRGADRDEDPDDTPVHDGTIGIHRRIRKARGCPRTGGRSWIRATTAPRAVPRYVNSAMPTLRGRRARLRGRSVATVRPRATSARRSPSAPSRSVTLPRLRRRSSRSRRLPRRRTLRARASRRRTIRPRTWRTTMTPRRSRTWTLRAPSGRVVRRTSAGWSPGSARRGGAAATWRTALAPGAIRSRRGRSRSHPTAPRAGRTRGRPRSERPNPARDTSTSSGRRPGFRTLIAEADAPLSVSRSGLTLSAMPRPVAAPGMDAATVARSTAASARLTCRSP